jgi:N-methylhydantoinase B
LGFTISSVLGRFSGDVYRGDIFLVNDPHAAGSHMNDMRVVYPVFAGESVFAWIVGFGHWTDVGGPEPGSFNASATSCFAEGLRVPPVRIYSRGVPEASVLDLIFANIRLPYEARGDLQAVVEACRAGEARVVELCDRYGVELITAVGDEMMQYSERLLKRHIRGLSSGTYECTDWVDVDLPHPDRPSYCVKLRMVVEEEKVIFDYRASDPAPVGPSGSPLPMTWSATVCGMLNVFPDVPFNDGVLRSIEVLTTPGSCVHVEFPGAVSGTGAGMYEKVLACVLSCFGQADPALASGGIYNLTNLTVAGSQPNGRPWVMYVWQAGGFGATPRGDGGPPMMSLFSAGTRNQPVEVLERAYPVLFESVAMIPDSMGAGRYRGGPGEERVFRLLGKEGGVLGAIGDRHLFPIRGVAGGLPGGGQDVVADLGGCNERSLGVNFAGQRLLRGERVRTVSGGGGGYGDPLTRMPSAVCDDVCDGLVSPVRAEELYGVVMVALDRPPGYEVDEGATLEKRQQLERGREGRGA